MHGFSNIMITEQAIAVAAERVQQRCVDLAKCSEHPDQLTRTFCSDAMAAAHQSLGSWMEAAGLQPRLDAVGNLIGANDLQKEKPILLIGSHLDTVVNAGSYDGTLGVLLGLAVVEVIREMANDLAVDVQVVAFSEEEGVRFRYPFIGSMGIAGVSDQESLQRTDEAGESMGDVLKKFGCPSDYQSASYQSRKVIGFIEAHMEQATRLEEEEIAVGIVTVIAGQTRAAFQIEGVAGHAGTVPHGRRRDALAAAAEMILAIEAIGRETDGLFATVGTIQATPGLSNVICGHTTLRLDLRHELDSVREQAHQQIMERLDEISGQREVTCTATDVQHTPAIPMDSNLCEVLTEAADVFTGSAVKLVSGAGHDAMIMSKLTRSCMLFVRCRDGISHHPDEFVSTDDIRIALQVMVKATLDLAKTI